MGTFIFIYCKLYVVENYLNLIRYCQFTNILLIAVVFLQYLACVVLTLTQSILDLNLYNFFYFALADPEVIFYIQPPSSPSPPVSHSSSFFIFFMINPGVVPFSLRISPEGNISNGDDKSKLAHQQTYRYINHLHDIHAHRCTFDV